MEGVGVPAAAGAPGQAPPEEEEEEGEGEEGEPPEGPPEEEAPGGARRGSRRAGMALPDPAGAAAGEQEASSSLPRRSSIIKDPANQKGGQKKTVSFSSMPSEKKISSAGDCISFMQAGCELKKVRPNSRLYNRFFTLDGDLQALRWEPSKKDPDKARLDISAIREIRPGKNTETFRHNGLADQLCEDCALSILHGDDYESLDLVARSADVANIWVSGLRYLVSRLRQGPDPPGAGREPPRLAWLRSVFEEADEEGNGILPEEAAVRLIRRLAPALKEARIRLRFKEIQRSKEKLTTRVTREEFCEVFGELCTRPEVYFLLVQISKNKEFVDAGDLLLFLEAEQGVAGASEDLCRDIVRRYEPSEEGRRLGFLAIDGFTRYLLSPECDLFDPEQRKVTQDMSRPLSHYYISSSRSPRWAAERRGGPADEVRGYERALRTGCRSVQLDVRDGPDGEPVLDGAAPAPPSFRLALEVIDRFAFAASAFPLILCLDHRCSVQQQKVMARHLKGVFGPKLFGGRPPGPDAPLPSPEELRGRVVVEGRKLPPGWTAPEGDVPDDRDGAGARRPLRLCRELSDLLAVGRSGLCPRDLREAAGGRGPWEIRSFSEPEASRLANESPEDLVNHNKRFLSRVHPAPGRTDSGNPNPQDFWNSGCQMVTMDFQTPGPMMDLHTGWFLQNGGCGYVLRPAVMRDEVSYFSANTKGAVPGISPQALHVKVISGQNFPKPKGAGAKGDVTDPYVCVEVHGIPADCSERRTKTVRQNGDDPVFDETFEFRLALPELAVVRFVVLDDDYIGDDFIGQYSVPFDCLQQGYRHVPLLSFAGEPLDRASLFVHVAVAGRGGGGGGGGGGAGGRAQKRSLSGRIGKRAREYTLLRNTGLRAVDDVFKMAVHPLREATDVKENLQSAIVSVKELCGLPPIASLKQCMLTLSSRLLSSDNTPSVSFVMKDNFPYLEPLGTIPDVQKKVLSAYDLMIQESRILIDTADGIHEKIVQCQKAGMEFHESLHAFGAKEGLKGRKLNKAIESFAWNITVLKGQGDLLRNAKSEAVENMKQIQAACVSCGLGKTGGGRARSPQDPPAAEARETSDKTGNF
uniref:Phosphoinositide phospholipase C n=2 Tax=Ornithorhynchus anatinus TaxID=9258 RepID=A0A6I8P3C4_ORNAN